MNQSDNQAQWIWHDPISREVNQYVEFRCTFDLADSESAELRIAVDSNFAAWVNGRFVGTGQFPDFPERKTFSAIDVSESVHRGKNVLAILVHYCGQDHFSYVPDEPGLWFVLQCGQDTIVSDEHTQCRVSKAYVQGPMARISRQRGFVFSHDAGNADDWIAIDYHPQGDWQGAAATGRKDIPGERPVLMLRLAPRPRHEIIAQGLLKRFGHADATVAELMQRDFLSARDAHELFDDVVSGNDKILSRSVRIACEVSGDEDGCYVVVDLGREECGFIDLELDAVGGTIVDIAVGEHLADLRVRAAMGGYNNFASRYITSAGRQRFVHYAERYAGRYVQLHFTNMQGPVTLRYAGLLPAEYPVDMRGSFCCSDSLSERIYEVSRRTLHLCMHERYEDCPWREQALYAEDARTEALVGYYVFGEYNLARVSLDLLGRSVADDGFVQICAPTRTALKIPSATMAWLIGLAEYVRFSGDIDQIEQHIQRADAMIETHCKRLVNDLLPCPHGKEYWQFYDWADGLSGSIARTDEEALSGQRFDAILNFLFIVALHELATVFDYCGQHKRAREYRSRAATMRQAAHEMFWNAAEHSYVTYVGQEAIEGHYAEMTQSLALLADVPEPETAHVLRDRLTQGDNGLTPISLGMAIYKYDAILKGPQQLGSRAIRMVTEEWRTMLNDGATTFWETIKGHVDFNGCGSLCHGFSTVPAYVYQAHELGIQPVEPGFSRFCVRPVFGDVAWASGKIPTPAGDIEVSWEKRGESYVGRLEHPEHLQPVFDDSGSACEWTVTTK